MSADQARMVTGVDYAELLQQVQAAAALDRESAERVLVATTVTLAERLSRHELASCACGCPRSSRR
jgi:uncharacterized protein (DUF2267 family)